MIPSNEFKNHLGPLAEKLTEEQIENLRQLEDKLADLFFDSWLENINADNHVDLSGKDDNMSVCQESTA